MNILTFADYHDEILRHPTEPVKFPLSDKDKKYIRDMIYSIQGEQLKAADAPFSSAAGMAANQWGINKRIFLYCPEGDTVNGLEVVINPSYVPLGDGNELATINGWEGCFSIPLATGNIKRFTSIRVTYQNEAGDVIQRDIHGWPARVWQHENDHLDGFLYDDHRTGKCLEKVQFNSLQEMDEFYSKRKKE